MRDGGRLADDAQSANEINTLTSAHLSGSLCVPKASWKLSHTLRDL